MGVKKEGERKSAWATEEKNIPTPVRTSLMSRVEHDIDGGPLQLQHRHASLKGKRNEADIGIPRCCDQ